MYNGHIHSSNLIMTNFAQVIQACQDANGAGSKAVIAATLAMADKDARDLIIAAMNPYATYGVKQYDLPTTWQRPGYCGVGQMFDLLQALESRSLTGDAARQAVTANLALFDETLGMMLTRVLDKDLRAGFSASTANKAWEKAGFEERVPEFDVMLADKCEDTADFEKYVTFPCQADWKYDGQRTICIVRQGQPVEYRSRPGLIMEHLAGIYDDDLLAIREEVGMDFVMDGESFAGDFTETMNAKKSGNDAAKAALRLRAFFMMPLADWMAQKTTITMRQNRSFLDQLFTKLQPKRMELSGGREVKDFQDMTEYCNHVIDVEKQEGLILKEWDAVYTWDRSFAWTKVKRFYDVDARFISFYPGKPKSRLANTVGGAKCVAFLESGERVEFDVGSGFSDKNRDDMRDNPAKWLAATHVIKYQDVSRSKNKTVASLRFCTYQHSRDDKLVEI